MVSLTLSPGATKALVGTSHFLTWASSAIVVGITAYFLDVYPHDQHLIFEIVIAALVLGLYLPSFVLPFLAPAYKPYYLPLNTIFSYLWLTSFIFAAQDYEESGCWGNAPRGGSCDLKFTSQAFIFIAFFFTLVAAVVDVVAVKSGASGVLVKTEKEGRPGA